MCKKDFGFPQEIVYDHISNISRSDIKYLAHPSQMEYQVFYKSHRFYTSTFRYAMMQRGLGRPSVDGLEMPYATSHYQCHNSEEILRPILTNNIQTILQFGILLLRTNNIVLSTLNEFILLFL